MKWAIMVLQLLPAIIEAIKAIETAIPEGGKGKEKLAAMRAILVGADQSLEELWPIIEKTIGVLVGLFNAVGTFKKS